MKANLAVYGNTGLVARVAKQKYMEDLPSALTVYEAKETKRLDDKILSVQVEYKT